MLRPAARALTLCTQDQMSNAKPLKTAAKATTAVPKKGSHSATVGGTAAAARGDTGEQVVLLAAIGMSPAILTETVWALANPPDGSDPVVPDRVIVVTTTRGRDQVARLFAACPQLVGQSPWDALRHSLEAKGHALAGKLRFGLTADDVRIITALDVARGRSVELPDIRDRQENEAAADFLLDQVRGVVENPDTRLVVSIAGGRKTMSALLYACMTLTGRETDTLTHILVNEPFESLPDFWFPSQPGGALMDRGGHSHEPSQAQVGLAHVPFVPLRNLFRRELGQPAGSFRRLMSVCRANVRLSAGENLRLEIETQHPRAAVNGRALELSPREHLVLLFFARRVRRGEIVLAAYDEALVDLNQTRKDECAAAPPKDWSHWRNSTSLNQEFNERDLTRILADLRAKARRAGGDAAFLADVLPMKGRCGLDIPAPMIFIK